jgi:tetratricopeptide (TPR) repeat protein
MRSWLTAALILALVSVTACTSKDPETLKREYVASGDRYSAEKKYPEAIIQYRNAIAQDARFGEARLKLAATFDANGDKRNAFGEYIRAADVMPENVEAQLRAGKILMAAGQFPEARARAEAALAKEPRNVNALLLMGNALAGLKDVDGAIAQIEDAVSVEPRLTFSYANLSLLQLGKGNPAAAENAIKRAVDIDPKSLNARLALANFYWARRQLDAAEREMKQALVDHPESPEVNRYLAAFYVTYGRRAEAESYLKAYAAATSEVDPELILADFYLNQNRFREALPVLTPLLDTTEGYGPASIRVATIDFQEGRTDRAYQRLDEVLKRFPKSSQALQTKAGFLTLNGKHSEALVILDVLLKEEPRAVRSQYLRAVALRSLRRTDEAIQALQASLQVTPESLPARALLAELFLTKGDARTALNLAGEIVKAQPRSGAAHLLLARALFLSGNAAAAERELLPIVKASPKSPEPQMWLGRIYLDRNDRPKARQAFARALELDPNSLLALNGLVTLDLVEKKFDSARALVDSRITTGKAPADVLYLAANTYGAIGDTAKAESLYYETVKADASFIDAYGRLGAMYVSQNRLDDAKQKFETAASGKPVVAATLIGMVLELQRKPAEAQVQYERALALDPRAAVAANNLAWLYAESGEKLDQALQLAQTAKSVLPNDANVSNTLGWVYYKKGLFEQAVTALREAADRNPKDAAKRYYLGLAYLKVNQPTQARQALEQALKLNPRFAHADAARQTLAGIQG